MRPGAERRTGNTGKTERALLSAPDRPGGPTDLGYYFTLQDVPVEELRLQKEEVIQARWVSFDQFRAYLKRGSVFRYPEIDEVLDAADGWLDDILGKETETS